MTRYQFDNIFWPRLALGLSASGALLVAFVGCHSAPNNKVINLSWVGPTRNEDDTPLTDLAGYRVYYGQNAKSLDHVVKLEDAATHFTSPELTKGTWYFEVAAIDAKGQESRRAGPVVRVIE